MQQLNQELLALTRPYIGRTDLVQGPGGNTSVKGEKGEMMIKASGFRFEEMNSLLGFSVVNYQNIRQYFNTVKITNKDTQERKSVDFILNNILNDLDGSLYPRPSMETGFHAVLDKYVVHTHSVWTNLVNCQSESESLLNKIREELNIPIASIPYTSPGFGLSYLISKVVLESNKNKRACPKIFFLANHGIIGHSHEAQEVHDLLNKVDQTIIRLLQVESQYPGTNLQEEKFQNYIPIDDFVNRQICDYKVDIEFFKQVLFPDQTVFFKDNISFEAPDSNKKIRIDKEGRIAYFTGYREAKSIHETMTAYFFIYNNILKSGKGIKLIPEYEQDYIHGMDMEKHRKSLME